ncbi:glycosyltransferase [Ferrovibrio sp.]|uniref:glycosyltransferase n=1 Tax=Ferrovibrio sp. TaxID=1917215 RepID=UPI001B4AB49B|nr:glycosyltransferase [Ferrovibrio sp.]MBP7063420.1 glycosyltransferase [Ferrovibrio sp.]
MVVAQPRRIRLLVIANGLGVGGTERHLLQVLPQLDRDRFDIRLLLMHRDGALESAMAAAGIAIHGGPFRRFPLRPLFGFMHALRLLRGWKPDLVHCFLPEAYLIGGFAAWLSGIGPRLMSRRSLNDYQAKHRLAGWLERRLHGCMTVLLGNSAAVVAQLAAEGVPAGRLGLLYNGVDLPQPSHARMAVRERLGLRDDTLVMVKVANLIPYKGHADLIEALALAAPALPADHMLLCVGDDTGHGLALRALAKAHGVADRILWLGRMDNHRDVAALLNAADIGLLVSHEEGFSNAVLEGMAAGLAMLVTDVGGNAEAVGESGLVVPARQPAALAAALAKLADPPFRSTLGAAAHRRAGHLFSLPACIARYDALYAALAAGASTEAALQRMREAS